MSNPGPNTQSTQNVVPVNVQLDSSGAPTGVVSGNGQTLPVAKISTDALGNKLLVDPSTGVKYAALPLNAAGYVPGLTYSVVLTTAAAVSPTPQNIPFATTQNIPYTTILFPAAFQNECNATLVGTPGAYSGIIVPSGFTQCRVTALLAASQPSGAVGSYWWSQRLRSGTMNLAASRIMALPIVAPNTTPPTVNIFTQSPWITIGANSVAQGQALVSVGDTISTTLYQNSGADIVCNWDSTSTWLQAEFR